MPKSGAVLYGGKLSGPDVSKAASSPSLPFVKVLRSGPGGWMYALQTWPTRNGPAELRFSRWQGTPTKLTFTATQEHLGIALEGKVTYDGKPIPTVSRAPGGVVIREYVYLDQQVAGQWKIIGGVSVKSNGTYRRMIYGGGRPAASSGRRSPGRTSARCTRRTWSSRSLRLSLTAARRSA